MNHLHATFASSIDAIDGDLWNTLCDTDYPFLRYEFFAALEHSGSTTHTTGWQPHHLVVSNKEGGEVVALMPLFIKTHSYGEYVFDWSWADAYRRQGMDYYPKLLNSIPFTPATGPRWGIAAQTDTVTTLAFMLKTLQIEASKLGASSCHSLFLEQTQRNALQASHNHITQQDSKRCQWQQREGYQYHWFNQNYDDFDRFLATMTSRKRKNIKKERQKIQQQEIIINTLCGDDIRPKDWQNFYLFYQMTYLKRSGHAGYLTEAFFSLIAQSLTEHLVMVQAQVNHDGEPQTVAAALCFKDSECLYGRYWGCNEDYDSLHFEACYYQGIEYAIRTGLQRFDPGAQGEHKIQRGFTPIKTYSTHWIAHPEFREAIGRFLLVESTEIDRYIAEACELLPFKSTEDEK